jgi:hypothetical protein
MIANVLTALGVAVTLLGVADQTIRLWALLDDWKQFPMLSLLQQKRVQYLLALSAMTLVTVLGLYFLYWLFPAHVLFSRPIIVPVVIQIGIWIVAATIGFKIVGWTLHGAGQFRILLRLATALVIVIALMSTGIAIFIVTSSFYDADSNALVTGVVCLLLAINVGSRIPNLVRN